MKRIAVVLLTALILAGCNFTESQKNRFTDANIHGVLPSNSGEENSKNLQKLIDDVSVTGGTIYISAGEYEFAENGTQTIGSHCIKMRSNVSIIGDGEETILKPVGSSRYGMDMFYFNDYLDTGDPVYLENCNFEDFVIDAAGTSCETYTSAGKGFMFNLFRNCYWKRVVVMNTDATGFGVDCPIDSSITQCTALGCGKAASDVTTGASGFGIGYGYVSGECISINDCVSMNNKKYGFFFEHQGRFDPKRYDLANQGEFHLMKCTAEDNMFNFGGILAKNVTYKQCTTGRAIKQKVFFEDCENCTFNGS